ncbi:Serine/threonine-protein kinase [Podila minutissima]|uniref:Serine/threonine-protein kinase ATG1 n=1 Tax=Podila minutissima TaxID=64525 RepID=A0A9P5SCI7_9FUNG|nr:Serine/threonine-protein kinase [Podila minutissima]
MASHGKGVPEATQVGDYIVEYEIGRGSFATVYKGHHKTTKEPVAIKSVLRSKLTKKLLENLASEINILKGIRHDHIVALVDCRETETHIHLVMEYCSQGDLSQYIKRKGDGPASLPPPPEGGLHEVVVRHFLKQLASALEFLRSKNLIHRDLKPQNLLLHPASSAKEGSGYGLPVLKIADFGFARSLPHLSLAETLCGSPLYMAPEILRYEKYDAKADLWSVGAVLYEMCTGKPPFRAQNHVELLKRIEKAQDVINFPGEVDERSGSSGASPSQTGHPFTPIGDDIKDLIRQLLKRNPVERISFEEFFMNPTVSNMANQSRSRVSSRRSVSVHESRSDSPSIESKRHSTLDPSRYIYESVPRDRNEKRPGLIQTGLKDQSDKLLSSPLRSKPRSLQEGSPPSQDHRPPLQLPLSSPSPHHTYVNSPSQQNYEPSSQPINMASRRMRSADMTAQEASPKSVSSQPSSQPYRKNTLVGIPDVSRRYSAPEDDALLDKDYVVVEKRAVELNVLADEEPKSILPLRPSLGTPPVPSPISARSGSPRATSTIAKALSMASMRLFGASSSPPSRRSNTPLIGFATPINRGADINPEENTVLQSIEDTAHKAYVVFQFADSKMKSIRPLDEPDYSPSIKTCSSRGLLTPEEQEPSRESILAEEAFFLYLRALALLQSGMDVARRYWEERRQESKPASVRLNNGVQWIRDRFNECLEKAESAKVRSGIDHRDESGVVIEKMIYERALELSKEAALKELAKEDYAESERSYQTSIWMLHAILDGAGEDGRSEAIEEDDREILNKFIRSIENRLTLLRRRIAART